MPDYRVKARKTSPVTVVDITADTRERAIEQVVATAAEGEEIEVMQVEQLTPDEVVPGPTGSAG